ncbi:hypothetical protein [Weissella viridescens]|uniref:Uncharacterized protein n=1 Tax=Weissella viridescens TaxID=1629 RepID=A0A0R2H815_WEIVI|nr:hypothetical protein [Weissella viridescens]KRN46215.1 hypothetical protein IV50_GL001198 [Weissella viridescens]SUP61425.1 Uncharacterised protein [Weissella viridescens]
MAKTLTLKESNEYFGFKEGKQLSFVATQKMYRRTVQYNRDLTKQSLEDVKLQQQIQKYWTDVEQLTNMIEDIRLSTLDDDKKFEKIEELQRILDTKQNPAADGEYVLRSVDRDIDALDAAVNYLHDVIDAFLSEKQRDTIDEANGTDTIDLARRVAGLILGIEEEDDTGTKKSEADREQEEDDKSGLNN